MITKAIINTDGGARGNPGPAGLGAVIKIGDQVHSYKKFIGEATNNQAEYLAVVLALEKAKELGVDEIDLFVDSQLICEQLKRNYKVKEETLQKLFLQTWNLAQEFKSINYFHVPREENKEADALVNQALDENT